MISISKIQDSVLQENHQLFVFPDECSGQRMIAALLQKAVAKPLPKLSLSSPKLLAIAANDQGSSFLPSQLFSLLSFYLSLLFVECHYVASQSLKDSHTTPAALSAIVLAGAR